MNGNYDINSDRSEGLNKGLIAKIVAIGLSILAVIIVLFVVLLNGKGSSSISFKNDSIRMEIGDSEILKVVDDRGKEVDEGLTWSSNNEKIATVDENGIVRAYSKGKTIITVKNKKNKKAHCDVVVYDSSIQPVETSTSDPKAEVTPTVTPKVTAKPTAKPTNTSKPTATPTKPTVTTKPPAVSKTYVLAYDANGGSVNSITKRVKEGEKIGELPTPTREGYIFSGWYTSATGGTQVTKDLVMKSNMTIYAHWNKKATSTTKPTAVPTAKATLIPTIQPTKVPDIIVTGISLKKSEVTLKINKTYELTAVITPTNATNKTVTWESGNTKIATVNKNGVVKGISAGTVTITATSSNGKKATCKVIVERPIASDGTIDNDYFKITAGSDVSEKVALKNSKGINAAIEYASANKIKNIKLKKSTYIIANIIEKERKRHGGIVQDIKTVYSIKMKSNINFDLNGSTIKLYTNSEPKYNIFYFYEVSNSSLFNGTIIGDRDTHTCGDGTNIREIDNKVFEKFTHYCDLDKKKNPEACAIQRRKKNDKTGEYKIECVSYAAHEWGHGIKIRNSNNITIKNLTIEKMTGDGISLSGNNIKITNNVIRKCRRQGITVAIALNLEISNNKIYQIKGTAPQSGINFEPDSTAENKGKKISAKIDNNVIYDVGLTAILLAQGGDRPIDYTITNNGLSENPCGGFISRSAIKIAGNYKVNSSGNRKSSSKNVNYVEKGCPDQSKRFYYTG